MCADLKNLEKTMTERSLESMKLDLPDRVSLCDQSGKACWAKQWLPGGRRFKFMENFSNILAGK